LYPAPWQLVANEARDMPCKSYRLGGIVDPVDVDFPAEFGSWLDNLEAAARSGDEHARTVLVFVVRALKQLRDLVEPPSREDETAGLR
jgi:hypothetical protein